MSLAGECMHRRINKLMIIFIVFFAIFFFTIFGLLFYSLDGVERADYYKLADDEISTFAKVTGYEKIRNMQSQSNPEMIQKTYVYAKVPDYAQNIAIYKQYLMDYEGFMEMSAEGVKMSGSSAILVKMSKDQGMLLTVQVLYAPGGVEITLQKIPGELTEN